jgi:hypothetical protein
MRVSILPWCMLVLVGGCFDPTVPTETILSCSDDAECPEAFTCRLSRCVPLEELADEAPQIVDVVITPNVAGRGARVEVSFGVVGALATDPAVEADVGRPVFLTLESGASTADGDRFVFSYVVDGSEPSGDVVLTASLTDRFGRESPQPLGTFTLDLAAPTILEPTISPERAKRGGEIVVEATLSEAATVTGVIALPGDQRVELDVVVTDGAILAAVTVDELRFPEEGEGVVLLRAVDMAGNDSGEVEMGVVEIDQRHPTVTWLNHTALVRPGDLARFIVSSDERVVAPRLVLQGAVAEDRDPDVEIGREIAWSWPVDDPVEESDGPGAAIVGDATVTFVPGTFVDLAGNEGTLEPVTLIVDRTPPLLSAVRLLHSRVRSEDGATTQLSGQIEDAHGIASAQASFLGRPSTCTITRSADLTTAAFTCTVAIDDHDPDGQALVSLVATDNAGNTSQASSSLTLDGEGPRVDSVAFSQPRARPGQNVSLIVIADEPFLSISSVFRSGDADFAFGPLEWQTGTSRFVLPVEAPLSGQMEVVNITLTDDLGNVHTQVLDRPCVLEVDGLGPQIEEGTVESDNDFTLLGATVGDIVTVRFSLTLPLLNPPAVYFGTRAMTFLEDDDDSDGAFTATYEVSERDTEGVTAVSVLASDDVGNLTLEQVGQPVLVDTTAPSLVSSSTRLSLRASSSAPATLTPTSLGLDGELEVSWTMSEPIQEAGSFTSPDGVPIVGAPGARSFTKTLSGADFDEDGVFVLELEQIDFVGNVGRMVVGTVTVDLTPPEPLSRVELDAMVHVRAPHGTFKNPSQSFVLDVRRQLENRIDQIVSVALDDGDTIRLGSASLGEIFTLSLNQNTDRVFLQVYDEAGNVANAPGQTPKTEYVAGLNGRVPGQDGSNPHRIELRRQFVDLSDDPSGVEQSGVAVGLDDDAFVVARPEGRWRSSLTQSPPSARSDAASTTHNGALFMFGGSANGALSDELWSYDDRGWSRLSSNDPTGPEARSGAGLASDGVRLVLFGGQGATAKLNDLWEWSGIRWKRVDPTAGASQARPTPRSNMVFAVMPRSQAFVVYGGESPTVDGRHWRSLDGGASWTELATGPSVARAAVGPVNDSLVVYGGVGPSGPLSSYFFIAPSGTSSVKQGPSARAAACAVSVNQGEALLVIGGTSGAATLGDRVLVDKDDATSFKNPALVVPVSQASCGRVGDDVVVFGGAAAGAVAPVDTLQALDLITTQAWRTIVPAELPTARSDFAVAHTSDALFLIGGIVGSATTGEVWRLQGTWNQIQGLALPPTRGGAAACVDTACIVVGGVGATGAFRSDALRFTFTDNQGSPARSVRTQGFSPRRDATAAIGASGELVVFGGSDTNGVVAETCIAQDPFPQGPSLSLEFECSSTSEPSNAAGARMVATPEGPILWASGGLWALNGEKWDRVSGKESRVGPEARLAPVLAFDASQGGRRLWLHGGRSILSNEVIDELWSFDFETEEWRMHEPADPFDAGAPSPRAGHAGFFDAQNERLVVSAANTGEAFVDTWDFFPGDTERAALVLDVDVEAAADATSIELRVIADGAHAVTIDGRTFFDVDKTIATVFELDPMPKGRIRLAIAPKSSGHVLKLDAVDIRFVRPPIVEP